MKRPKCARTESHPASSHLPCEKMYKNLTGEEKKTNPCRKQTKSARIGRKKLFRAGKTAKTSAGGSEKASVGADVCEGGDRDPGRERESLSEHGTAGVQGRPGRERIVDQEDVGCRAWSICIVTCIGSLQVTGKGEGAADIGRLGRHGQADLGTGAARAAEDVRAELGAKRRSELARDHLRLVVAAPPLPRPVQRHWDDDVHVGKLRRGCQAFAQHAGEVPPGREPTFILQVPGNMAVVRGRIVEEQRRSEGIRLVPAGRLTGRICLRLAIQAQNR